jgi:hypothetical protein
MPAVNRHQQLLDLEELAAKLLEAARKLPPGEIRHGTLKEIGRVRARLTLLRRSDPLQASKEGRLS